MLEPLNAVGGGLKLPPLLRCAEINLICEVLNNVIAIILAFSLLQIATTLKISTATRHKHCLYKGVNIPYRVSKSIS